MAYCILYPYSPFEDLGNSRGLNLPILQQLWNSMGRAIIYNYLSIIIPWDTSRGMPFLCINVYIPYWKFRSMPFLCIMYTMLKFQRQEVYEIYQIALSSRRGHKTMIFPRVSKLGIPWVRKLPGIPSPPIQITWNFKLIIL